MKIIAAALAAGCVLAACGTIPDTVPVGAPLVVDGSQVTLPARAASGHSVAVHGTEVAAVTVDADGLAYQHSTDGGRTWQRSALNVPASEASVALSGDGAQAAVMATLPGSSSTGGLPALFSGPATGTLTARQAPVAGDLAWAGSRLVLAGGPQRALLYSSDDRGATWTQRSADGVRSSRFNVAPDAPSYGTPLTTVDGSVTLPLNGNGAVRLYTTKDGVTYTPGPRVPLTGDVAPGATVPVASAGPGEYVIADPAGTLHVVVGTTQSTVTPSGLPGAVDTLTFTDSLHGVAEVAHSCTDKANCVRTVSTVSTEDGGHTWK